jgi:hypothetical protein
MGSNAGSQRAAHPVASKREEYAVPELVLTIKSPPGRLAWIVRQTPGCCATRRGRGVASPEVFCEVPGKFPPLPSLLEISVAEPCLDYVSFSVGVRRAMSSATRSRGVASAERVVAAHSQRFV